MSTFRPLPQDFYRRSAALVAVDLLGRYLVRRVEGERLVLRIVETEAYLGACDRASHAWGDRRTARTAALFRGGGVAYVYLIYGVHCMLNVVTGTEDDGSAVLIRSGEPIAGSGRMKRLRGLEKRVRPGDLAGGPGKLCRALDIDLALNRAPLGGRALAVTQGEPLEPAAVVAGPRVGIDYAGEATSWPLRFAERGNPHVSRPPLGAQGFSK